MKIIVDQNIPGVEKTFGLHGEIMSLDGRKIKWQHLEHADALIVRSITTVNSDLLENTRIRFVGSTTIGFDHLDTNWLKARDIAWACAPGCNADSAAQYTLGMMLLACKRMQSSLSAACVGIIGYGNVGSRIEALLQAVGVKKILICDPPLADAGKSGLVEMGELHKCDIITTHVPLTYSGLYPTHNLLDQSRLASFKKNCLLINTSRGNVIQKEALIEWLSSRNGYAALDVWPDEPEIDSDLLQQILVATPHVAGYSIDGKLQGTQMIYQQFADHFGIRPRAANLLTDQAPTVLDIRSGTAIEDIILEACPVERDDRNLRGLESIDSEMRSAYFDQLRREYPLRRDFGGFQLKKLTETVHSHTLKKLGFN